jgi:hypothetical protein
MSIKIPALLMFIVPFILMPQHLMLAQEEGKPRKCILVFGAHADDVDEIAGGTFAKYIDEGYEGVYVCYTNNTVIQIIQQDVIWKEPPIMIVDQISLFQVRPGYFQPVPSKRYRSVRKKPGRLQVYMAQNLNSCISGKHGSGRDANNAP